MPNKQTGQFEEGEPLEDDPEMNERLRTIAADDPGFDAWRKQKYGHNPYLKQPNPRSK